jgi:hypothetical protein
MKFGFRKPSLRKRFAARTSAVPPQLASSNRTFDSFDF